MRTRLRIERGRRLLIVAAVPLYFYVAIIVVPPVYIQPFERYETYEVTCKLSA